MAEAAVPVGVVGCGQMGSGIAEVCARGGLSVTVVEANDEALRRGEAAVRASLERGLARGKMTEEERDAALGRLAFSARLSDLAGARSVFEAVTEREEEKTALFSALDALLEPGALLCSNTSSIPISRLAAATSRPGFVIGVHFFNPVPVLPLVEVVPSLLTEPAVTEEIVEFVSSRLGRRVIEAPDRAGFIVNGLLVPYLLSAVRMVESGAASPEAVDTGMEVGCAHPMGPLRLSDFIGLDTVKFIAETLYEEYREPAYAPPPLLSRMVEAGLLGRKSGRGFYRYE